MECGGVLCLIYIYIYRHNMTDPFYSFTSIFFFFLGVFLFKCLLVWFEG